MTIIKQVIIFLFALLAALVGDFIVRPLMGKLRNQEYLHSSTEASRWLGYIERFLYVTTWFIQPQFIGIWLGVKALGGWSHYRGEKREGRGDFTVFLVGTGLSLLVSAAFIWIIQILFVNGMDLNWKNISEIFNNLAVGIGAILAGFTGIVAVLKYFRYLKEENIASPLREMYPRIDLNKEGKFYLVHSPISGQENRIYLIDLKAKKRRWIMNPHSLNALGFEFSDTEADKDKAKKVYDESSEGSPIDL